MCSFDHGSCRSQNSLESQNAKILQCYVIFFYLLWPMFKIKKNNNKKPVWCEWVFVHYFTDAEIWQKRNMYSNTLQLI